MGRTTTGAYVALVMAIRHYELVKQEMIAQVDRKSETGLLGLGQEQAIVRVLQREFRAVVSCWRSTSQVPPWGGTDER